MVLCIVVAERAVQNISRTQGINHLYGFDGNLTIVFRSTIENGTLTAGDCPVSDTLASQIRHDALFVAPIGRLKLLGANRDVNVGKQSLHPLLPTSSVEHDRNPTLSCLHSHPTAGFHVEPVNEHHTIVVLVGNKCHLSHVGWRG